MDDRTLVNTGMVYSEKAMEAADDVIQALLANCGCMQIWEVFQVLRNEKVKR